VRQGSGKGPVEAWVCVVRPGRIVYEIAGVSEETAREAMRLAGRKLPMPTRFVAKAD
jgi:large subunit ribosomal protein L16